MMKAERKRLGVAIMLNSIEDKAVSEGVQTTSRH